MIGLLRGPLNQKASAVQSNVPYETSGSLGLSLAQKLPTNYTGLAVYSRAKIMQIARLTPEFAQVMQQYSQQSNISMQYSDCGNSCSATVKVKLSALTLALIANVKQGFGFKTKCSVTEYDQLKVGPAIQQPIFVTSTSLYPIGGLAKTGYFYENAGIMFNVTYRISAKSGDQAAVNGTGNLGANGTLTNNLTSRMKSHICNVTGGSVEYKVRLSSQTIALASNRSEDRFLEDQ